MENRNNFSGNHNTESGLVPEMITGHLWCSPDHKVVFVENHYFGSALSEGQPLAVCLNENAWYPAVLDHIKFPDGQYGWVLAGTSIRNTDMNGLIVRIPINLWIQRNDGNIYAATRYACDLPAGHTADGCFYRYSEMPETDATRKHLAYLLGLYCEKKINCMEYRRHLEQILRDSKTGGESWNLIKQALDRCISDFQYVYCDGDELIDEYIKRMEELTDAEIKKRHNGLLPDNPVPFAEIDQTSDQCAIPCLPFSPVSPSCINQDTGKK